MKTNDSAAPRSLIVVPCLNEEAHIGAVIDTFAPQARDLGARLVIADGGSSRPHARDRRRSAPAATRALRSSTTKGGSRAPPSTGPSPSSAGGTAI